MNEDELIRAHGVDPRRFDKRRRSVAARFRLSTDVPPTVHTANTDDALPSESTSMPTDVEASAIERRVRNVG